MSVRHWEILKNGDTSYLIHKYCLATIHEHELPTCAERILGTWICTMCNETAPDEIGFAADLGETYHYGNSGCELPSLPQDYTPDLYNHKGEWLNGGLNYPMPDPVIATPQEYLFEKIQLEVQEQRIKDYEGGWVTIWKDWEEEFKTSSPVYVHASTLPDMGMHDILLGQIK